jgi:hypothetical protein
MKFEYEYEEEDLNTRNYDDDNNEDVENPTSLWKNNCGATEKECEDLTYFGGKDECAQGSTFWRVFKASEIHPGV